MERLEEIVRLLEKGEAPLNESMKLFEEGTKLVRRAGQAAGQGGTESDRDAGNRSKT